MREPNPPEGAEALHWIILSTWPITDAKSAREALGWYVQRWQIEVLHRTWKTGCKVEERRVQEPQTMLRLMMLDLMVAVPLLSLVKAARLTPEASACNLLSAAQSECLAAHAASSASAPKPLGPGKGNTTQATAPPGIVSLNLGQPQKQPLSGEAQIMSLAEAVEKIARLGGYRDNMKKRPPGAELLWRGIQRLHDLTTGWLLAKTQKSG